MAAGLIDGYRAQLIDRARQLHVLFPVEIDEVQIFELVIREQYAHDTLVLRRDRKFFLTHSRTEDWVHRP